MSAPARLVLVRHGESTYNAEDRLQGQSDPPLSERGREQARGLAPTLSSIPVRGVVASDLARALETAALAGAPPDRVDARWREIEIGEWTDRLNAEIPLGELEAWRAGRFIPAGGESWEAFLARVAEAVEELAAAGGDWLVVTHGGCVRAAAAHVMGADVRVVAGPANCSVTMLELAPQRRLLAFNRADSAGLPRPSDPGGTVA